MYNIRKKCTGWNNNSLSLMRKGQKEITLKVLEYATHIKLSYSSFLKYQFFVYKSTFRLKDIGTWKLEYFSLALIIKLIKYYTQKFVCPFVKVYIFLVIVLEEKKVFAKKGITNFFLLYRCTNKTFYLHL